MKERPILFSGAMVRALLTGAKTQTRRIVKPARDRELGCELAPCEIAGEINAGDYRNSRYGRPGDRLWVRETWQGPLVEELDAYRAEPDNFKKPDFCSYAADGGSAPEFMTMDDELVRRWKPSIHMPRWASRIALEITAVRIEQLLEISIADAIAEGVVETCPSLAGLPACMEWRYAYEDLWNKINGNKAWASNPWVWVVEFKVVTL